MKNKQYEAEEVFRMLPVAQKEQNLGTTADKMPWYGVRYTQTLLMFSYILLSYGMRSVVSVGIVAMTNPAVNPDFPTYNWSMTEKANVLSSFFYGYAPTQMVAGKLVEMYRPKWFLLFTMLIGGITTVLMPMMADISSWAVAIFRIALGITQGFLFPSVQYLLCRWAPLSERLRMSSFIYGAGPLGSVICMFLTGWISASSFGWPSVFYSFGATGFIWCIFWMTLGADSPSDYKNMSVAERKYLQQETSVDDTSKKKYPTPYKHIAKSLPVWGILAAYCGQNWGYWTLMTEIPTYMNGVLHFNIKSNGLVSAAPYFALWVASFFVSYFADLLTNKKILSIVAVRKIASGISLVGSAIPLIILGLIENPTPGIAVTLLIIAVALNAGEFCGHHVNHIDIAPTHAATLIGISNGTGNIFAFVAPWIVPYIVTDETNSDQWRIVFFISAGVYIATDLVYTIFGKAEIQYWDKLEESDEKSHK